MKNFSSWSEGLSRRKFSSFVLSPLHILVLEVIALWAMVIDHLGRAHIYSVWGWEIVGRVAFPLFVMTFAYNATAYRRCNIWKLVVIGLLAMPATSFLFDLQWWQPNVMFVFPVGWFVFRYFADAQRGGAAVWLPLVLCLAVVWLSLGPSYDVRGVAMVAMALGVFAAKTAKSAMYFCICCYLLVVGTLLEEPHKIISVTLLLGSILVLVMMMVSPREVGRSRATWWGRAGFGKWYVVHAYVLCALKWLGS